MALIEISEGRMSFQSASNTFKIPVGTLYNRYKGKHDKPIGRMPTLKMEEEAVLVRCITICGEWGYPISLYDIRMIVRDYLISEGVNIPAFRDGVTPGADWASAFLQRNRSTISNRNTRNINQSRASINEASINLFFDEVEKSLKDTPPENIFNMDETAVVDDSSQAKRKLLYRRGTKYPTKVENFSKTNTTLVMCGSATGVLLPPYIIYKSEYLYDQWVKDGPKGKPCCEEVCCRSGSHYNRSISGWIDTVQFADWFFTTFIPHADHLQGKVVIICDNLASHFSPRVILECEKRGISFLPLIPNSTHLTQPLDVSFFGPFKRAWRNTIMEFRQKNPCIKTIPKVRFPPLVHSCLQKMDTLEINGKKFENRCAHNLRSGFTGCGYNPLNRHKVLHRLPGVNTSSEQLQNLEHRLVSYLEMQRYGSAPSINTSSESTTATDASMSGTSTPLPKKIRCRRINVVAGRSVTSSDINTQPIVGPKEPQKRGRKRKSNITLLAAIPSTSSSSLSSGIQASSSSLSGMTASSSSSSKRKASSSTSKLIRTPSEIAVKQWVVVMYSHSKGNRNYLGKIIRVRKGKIVVKYVRPKVTSLYSGFVFAFPNVPDVDTIEFSRIRAIVPAPVKYARALKFGIDVNYIKTL